MTTEEEKNSRRQKEEEIYQSVSFLSIQPFSFRQRKERTMKIFRISYIITLLFYYEANNMQEKRSPASLKIYFTVEKAPVALH